MRRAVWSAGDPVRRTVLALFSGEALAPEALPFLEACLPGGLPPLAAQDICIDDPEVSPGIRI